MKLADVTAIVSGIPHATPAQGKIIYDSIYSNGFKSCIELGFAHGVGSSYIAAALDELGQGGRLTSIDLPFARDRNPAAPDVIARTGLAHYVDFIFHELGYNWYLMEAIEQQKRFDFCFLDGAHTWDVDALAFTLVDKLLLPGGLIIFDDLDWTYAASPTMSKVEAPEQMRRTAGIRKVVELLVKQNPGYRWLGEAQGMGAAQKIAG
jgi:predicted O-methyltransferase YrrM